MRFAVALVAFVALAVGSMVYSREKPTAPVGAPGKRLYGPIDGKLTHTPGGGIQWRKAGLRVRDCVVEVTFFNPDAASAGQWAEVLFFRLPPGPTVASSRLFVNSDGTWGYGTTDEKGRWKGQYRKLPERVFAVNKGDRNHFRVILNGNQGQFVLNGTLLGNLDLSGNVGIGDVAAAIDLTAKEARTVHFETFRVFECLPPGANSLEIGKVTLDRKVLEVEVSSEKVEAPAGVVAEFKKSRTITREVAFSLKAGVGGEVEKRINAGALLIKGELAARVRASVEAAASTKYADSETREQTVRIDGAKIQKATITWIDTYRTGTIEVARDGRTYSIPFRFPLGTRLVIRKQE